MRGGRPGGLLGLRARVVGDGVSLYRQGLAEEQRACLWVLICMRTGALARDRIVSYLFLFIRWPAGELEPEAPRSGPWGAGWEETGTRLGFVFVLDKM